MTLLQKEWSFMHHSQTDVQHDSDDPEYLKASGYHAAEHVIIEGSNMVTGGASQDLGGISLGTSGLVFVYDGAVGKAAVQAVPSMIDSRMQIKIVKECPCTTEDGCPRCTYSYRCGNNNEYLHKAAEIFERICDGQTCTMVSKRW